MHGSSEDRRRLHGLDVARGVALVGMFLAHYADAGSGDDAGWLQALDNAADGRAAPLFCVLLGVGAGILAGRRGSVTILRRGVALLALGLAVWPLVEHVWFILPQYGLLLLLMAGAARLPTDRLLPAATVAWLVPTIVVATVDGHGLRSATQPDTYAALTDVGAVGWQLLWSGGYPVVGWLGFALVGLWLSRQSLRRPEVQRRLLAGAVVVAAAQPALAAIHAGLGGRTTGDGARGLVSAFDTTSHSNQLGWYVVASATAVAVIAGCLLLSRRSRLRPLELLGRFALSAYLLHLAMGSHVVWPWRERTDPSLALQIGVTLLIAGVMAAVAAAWSSRFERGPAEAVLRGVDRAL